MGIQPARTREFGPGLDRGPIRSLDANRSASSYRAASDPVPLCCVQPVLPQALFDLEATNAELKADLRELYINAAREIDITSTRKAILIQVRGSARDVIYSAVNVIGMPLHRY